MVRLKALLKIFIKLTLTFQFQYGTIKRITNELNMTVKTEFQFQYGTIKRVDKTWYGRGSEKFQFQYGTIKSRYKDLN